MVAGGITGAAGDPIPEKWEMFGEVELKVPLTLVCASTYIQRQCKSEAAAKIMLSLFCRCYLASCHHPDSHYPFCLLSGGFVQSVPEENSRYLVCFLCRESGGEEGESMCFLG